MTVGRPSSGTRRYLADNGASILLGLSDRAVELTIDDQGSARVIHGDLLWADGARAAGPTVFAILFPVPRAGLQEFDSWFCTEHGSMLRAAKGWDHAALYALAGDGPTRLAVHSLSDASALGGPERVAAGRTEWTNRLFAGDWTRGIERFTGSAVSGEGRCR